MLQGQAGSSAVSFFIQRSSNRLQQYESPIGFYCKDLCSYVSYSLTKD